MPTASSDRVSPERGPALAIALGRRIAAERQGIGMTQTLLAELAGLERDRLNKVEHGRRQLKATEAARIAAVLGVSVSDLDPQPDPMRFRDRADGPAAQAAVELFGRFIRNCEIIESLKAFDAD